MLLYNYIILYTIIHRIHGAAIYGNMDPINIPPMLAYMPAPWILWVIYYYCIYIYNYIYSNLKLGTACKISTCLFTRGSGSESELKEFQGGNHMFIGYCRQYVKIDENSVKKS